VPRGHQEGLGQTRIRAQPLAKVPDTAIKEVGIKRFEDDDSDVAWMGDEDESAASLADRIGLERRET